MKTMKIVGIILVFCSFLFIGLGTYKKDVYEEGTTYREGKNAYVGGDAYNLIINGTYFAGYYALGGAIFVSGIIMISAGAIIEELQSKNNNTYKCSFVI